MLISEPPAHKWGPNPWSYPRVACNIFKNLQALISPLSVAPSPLLHAIGPPYPWNFSPYSKIFLHIHKSSDQQVFAEIYVWGLSTSRMPQKFSLIATAIPSAYLPAPMQAWSRTSHYSIYRGDKEGSFRIVRNNDSRGCPEYKYLPCLIMKIFQVHKLCIYIQVCMCPLGWGKNRETFKLNNKGPKTKTGEYLGVEELRRRTLR